MKIFLKILTFFVAFTIISAFRKLNIRNLSVLHEWNDFIFGFPSEVDRVFAIQNGLYVKGNAVPIDFDIEYKGNGSSYRTFVTVPRLSLGIPYTLASLQDNGSKRNPILVPFPNYSIHASHGTDCNGITSVMRIIIDECKRLWLIDSGQIATVQFCPPQIIAFDLETENIVHRFTIPQIYYVPSVSVFTSILIDIENSICSNARIYIADSWGHGLIVYDMTNREIWRIEHETMYPESSFQRDGIFSISLSPKTDKERKLYFHTLSSKREMFVPLHTINDWSKWKNNLRDTSSDFKVLGNRRIQCESEAADSSGNLYCSVLSLNALISWDSRTRYDSDNIKIYVYNPEQLKFVTGIKIFKNTLGEDELWLLSSDPKLFYGGHMMENQVKFRILGCRKSDFLNGRKCTVEAA